MAVKINPKYIPYSKEETQAILEGVEHIDETPTEESEYPVSSGGVRAALNDAKPKEIPISSEIVSISPNNLYLLGTRSSLTVSLAEGEAGIINEYMFEFVVNGDDFTLTLPSSVKWIEEPVFENGYKYQVSILNNLAVTAGWEIE